LRQNSRHVVGVTRTTETDPQLSFPQATAAAPAPAASSFASPHAPSVKATESRSQAVKLNFDQAPLAARRPVAPALLFATKKDPRLLRDVTTAITSGAAVLSVNCEQKSFPEFAEMRAVEMVPVKRHLSAEKSCPCNAV
jgi:hypothetical protein